MEGRIDMLKTVSDRAAILLTLLTLLAGLATPGCRKTEPPPDPRTAAQKSDAEWFNAKAKATKGNFDALTAEEKQRAIRFSRNSESDARMGFGFAKNAK